MSPGTDSGVVTKLLNFDPADYIPTYFLAQASPYFWLSFLCSWAVCYLVHQPNDTRTLRRALWPIAVASNLWGVLTVDLSGRLATWCIVGLVLFNATSAAIRWGLATAPPTYHPLPKESSWPSLRQSDAFKALDLLFNEARLLSIIGSSPPLQRSPHSSVHHIFRHLFHFLAALISIDMISYPLYHYDSANLGHPMSISADWDLGIEAISSKSGVPPSVVVFLLIFAMSAITYLGNLLVWHPAAMLGIASGIWVPEEWPKLMTRPWMATSLNELWGKRYHQMLRNSFHTYTHFLSFLPRYLAIFRIFLISALYHILCFHPHHRVYKVYYLSAMFLLSGVGLELERQFYRITGRRVGGWSGRIWMWTWFTMCGYFMTRAVAEIGWLGGLRRMFAEDRRTSVVEWALYAYGVRPHPSEPIVL